jgi:phosphoenolpyruvate synthase/pyruvate phosphate dikinase
LVLLGIVKQLISLAEVHPEDAAGGKAASLAVLLRAGFRVPPGFVVAATEDNLEALETDILQAFDRLGVRFVAVRSSATQEDGHEAAWAGQLDTFLNVPKELLLTQIGKCLASTGSPRAQAYAAQKGLPAGSMAVIVQAMVDSDISGVAFSAHPVTGSRDHMVIEAGLGLGEAIVSGEITPDTYVIETASGSVAEASIASQAKQLVRGKHGACEWQPIDPPVTQPKLSSKQLAELIETMRKLADFHGFPIDVEWAFASGMLYILQARPITTLG